MGTDAFLGPKSFLDKIKSVFSGNTPKAHIEELEQAMIEADIDLEIIEGLVSGLKSEKIPSFESAKEFLKKHFMARLSPGAGKRPCSGAPLILLLVGINGAGKTTTAAKLAGLHKKDGKRVMFIAADTFRAAAAEQLEAWAGSTGVDIIRGMDGADPASVVFDGLIAAKKAGHETVIIDTAGRLHTKENLMQELLKIKKIIVREMPAAGLEILIIVDANTGKNAFTQAKQFNETLGLTGVILTKFDSTSKGGSVVKIRSELNLPVLYYTFGENVEDIAEFNAEKFVERLFE
jgi:fused signal recognition particle receptor